jgi:GH25 family lysozyme M1 (1,4-beta-N-acetylmuramidase)
MKTNDFLLCTFDGDTNIPPIQYAAEITSVNADDKSFECFLPSTNQEFTFHYSAVVGEVWTGTDKNADTYVLATHDIYTGGNIDPYPQGLAVVKFADGLRYLCYVESIDPVTKVLFYYSGTPELCFDLYSITKSNWDKYVEGDQITNIEGYIIDNVVHEAGTDATVATDVQSRQILLVDLHEKDVNGNPAWNVLVNTPGFYGAIIKATQGPKGYSNDHGWFKKNWPIVRSIGGDRYGSTWFRGAYLFLNLWDNGITQAEHYLATVLDAGGWANGDMIPIIDVELGNDGAKDPKRRNGNQDASTQLIIDCTTACADKLRSETGRNVMLYGRGAMRDRGIVSKMGCDAVWNPAYTSTMVVHGLEAWTLDEIVLWQYCGDGVAAIDEKKLPRTIANFGKVDISVYIDGSRKTTLESFITRLGIGTI